MGRIQVAERYEQGCIPGRGCVSTVSQNRETRRYCPEARGAVNGAARSFLFVVFYSRAPQVHFGRSRFVHLFDSRINSFASACKEPGFFSLSDDVFFLFYSRNHFLFTPLLASTSVGTLEFRCITEPVRGYTRNVEYHQAWCDTVDFEHNKVDCTLNLSPSPAIHVSQSARRLSTAGMNQLSLNYDHLIIGVGSYSNTFNIPGVKEHAFFLKEVSDARKIRSRVLECFERAEMSRSDEEKNGLLHFAVVGGGPTGVEFSSELHDFIREDCSRLFPGLMNHVTLAVYDVAPTILANFDKSLAEYCMNKFRRSGIEVRTGTVVDKVEDGKLVLKDGKEIPFGCLVWSTGLTENPLTASLEGKVLKSKSKRILTDEYLRVLDPEGKVIPHVYALGDCATIKGKNGGFENEALSICVNAQCTHTISTFCRS